MAHPYPSFADTVGIEDESYVERDNHEMCESTRREGMPSTADTS